MLGLDTNQYLSLYMHYRRGFLSGLFRPKQDLICITVLLKKGTLCSQTLLLSNSHAVFPLLSMTTKHHYPHLPIFT